MTFLVGLRFDPRTVDHVVRLTTHADRAGVDLIAFDDRFAGDGPRLDALATASHLAPRTRTTGLAPTVTTTHTEPFHVATATQTLDLVSLGRGAWTVDVALDVESARVIGRRPAPTAAAAWTEALDVVDAVRALWDSWDDDAVIRDRATGRYVDVDRLHHVDATVRGTDATFSITGPSIVPRTPGGQPVVVLRLAAGAADDDPRWPLVSRHADVVVVDGSAPDDGALAATVQRVRDDTAGRPVRVLAGAHGLDVSALLRAVDGWDVDGVELGGPTASADAVTDLLTGLTAGGRRGPERHPLGSTLRERLGLPRPTNRFEVPA
ncbi:LLM class flavin-dependent oxidoreductase [Jatrophihabitans sp. YIM 134969]